MAPEKAKGPTYRATTLIPFVHFVCFVVKGFQRNNNTGTEALRITLVVVLPTRKRRITEWP